MAYKHWRYAFEIIYSGRGYVYRPEGVLGQSIVEDTLSIVEAGFSIVEG